MWTKVARQHVSTENKEILLDSDRNQIFLLTSMLALTMIMSILVKAANPIKSLTMIDGAYAEGSTFYSSNSASASTVHPVYSVKSARVQGVYMLKNQQSKSYVWSYENADYGYSPVSASISLPSDGDHFIGSKGLHTASSWYGESTSGTQY